MGVLGTIRSIFGGLVDDDGATAKADATAGAAADDPADGLAEDVADGDGNGLPDSVDEEMAINAVDADIEAEKERATDKLLNYPGME